VATIVGAGETPDPDDADDALLSLNLMLDAWQAEKLFAFSIAERTHALTAGVGSYTVGALGTIAVSRPVEIEWAFTRDSHSYDRWIEIIPEDVYQSITLKSMGNTFPMALFYEQSYPLGVINLWQLPSAGLTLHFGAWVPLTEYASLSDAVALPPGYEDALVFSLAERACPEYGKTIPADLARMGALARKRIKQNNLPDPRVACEFTGGQSNAMTLADFIAGNF
jgi:hypothetical protein